MIEGESGLLTTKNVAQAAQSRYAAFWGKPFIIQNSDRRLEMTKVVNCRDLGFDCEGVVRAESEEEALQMVAQHAKEVHGMDEVPPEVVEKVHEVMLEE